MACPFFEPEVPFSWEEWPNPPRLPLGDPHTGVCTVQGGQALPARVRTCCNAGYARGTCPSFPGGDAPDAVRFGIVRRDAGVATLQYVIERDHHPYDHGTLEVRESSLTGLLPDAPVQDGPVQDGPVQVGPTLQHQARAFLASYLRRAL